MNNSTFKNLVLVLFFSFILIPSLKAEPHLNKGRPEDSLKVIRHKDSTYTKKLTEGGIQITLIDKFNEEHNYSYTLNDFKSEKGACTKGVGRVIVMSKLEPGKLDSLIKNAEKLGFKSKEVIPLVSAVAFEYDCDKISLTNIHDLFLHQDVLLLEPDVKVQAFAYDYM